LKAELLFMALGGGRGRHTLHTLFGGKLVNRVMINFVSVIIEWH
jgi:hypothetical protein